MTIFNLYILNIFNSANIFNIFFLGEPLFWLTLYWKLYLNTFQINDTHGIKLRVNLCILILYTCCIHIIHNMFYILYKKVLLMVIPIECYATKSPSRILNLGEGALRILLVGVYGSCSSFTLSGIFNIRFGVFESSAT